MRYPGVPWSDIRGFGNVLRHGYDEIDDRVLWKTIEVQLQPLRDACETELTALQNGAQFER